MEQVEEVVAHASESGTVGVSIIGPDGARWEHHGDRKFGAASTVKIPIMVEIFRQIDAGQSARSMTAHVFTDADMTPGSGVMLHLHEGMEFTLNDLIYLMISISDNIATNILIRMAGMENVNRTMRDLGMTNSILGREMKGRPAAAGEQENWADAERLRGGRPRDPRWRGRLARFVRCDDRDAREAAERPPHLPLPAAREQRSAGDRRPAP